MCLCVCVFGGEELVGLVGPFSLGLDASLSVWMIRRPSVIFGGVVVGDRVECLCLSLGCPLVPEWRKGPLGDT